MIHIWWWGGAGIMHGRLGLMRKCLRNHRHLGKTEQAGGSALVVRGWHGRCSHLPVSLFSLLTLRRVSPDQAWRGWLFKSRVAAGPRTAIWQIHAQGEPRICLGVKCLVRMRILEGIGRGLGISPLQGLGCADGQSSDRPHLQSPCGKPWSYR